MNNINNLNINKTPNQVGDINKLDIKNNNEKDTIKAKRYITMLGDSTIKRIESYKIREGMLKDEKVYVKSFPGAKTACMEDYMKPSLKNKPDVILLRVGTNNLRTDNTPEDISNDIINLATTNKTI